MKLSCPLSCGSETEPRVVDAGGITIFICPECLGVSFDAAVLADPRRDIDLNLAIGRVVSDIRREHSVDPLTRIKNRAFFFRRLEAEIHAAAHRNFISVAAFAFSSREDDAIVKGLAASLLGAVRIGDDLARVEPSVFGLILRNADTVTAEEITRRIVFKVRKDDSTAIVHAVSAADGLSPQEAWREVMRQVESKGNATR